MSMDACHAFHYWTKLKESLKFAKVIQAVSGTGKFLSSQLFALSFLGLLCAATTPGIIISPTGTT